jgi:hypothetical protein
MAFMAACTFAKGSGDLSGIGFAPDIQSKRAMLFIPANAGLGYPAAADIDERGKAL